MRRSRMLKWGAGLGGVLLLGGALLATGVIPSPTDLLRRGPAQNDMVIDATVRGAVIDGVLANLDRHYVFPEQAKAVETQLRARQQRGEYDAITSAEELAATLTDELQQITKDRHLDVAYSEAPLSDAEFIEDPDAEPSAEALAELKRRNYGIRAVERLKNDIGYIDLRAFAPAAHVAPHFAAAMTELADTQALIIDLRANNGGEPETVNLLASYLFDKRTRLNDIYLRDGDRTIEGWTRDDFAGPRYGGARKVYLLISRDTFSAGEDFAYALKNLKRATLIGAATGGGAHPGSAHRINEHFAMIVPSGRSISPITQTDWEGVGVQPDVAIDPDDALDHAQMLILKGNPAEIPGAGS